jgi:soluble lytic murein transglycosylase-like protein
MKKSLCLLLLLLIASFAWADVNMDIVAQIESNKNPNAISYRGAKYGRGYLQISEICLKEWNQFNKVKYTVDDLFDKEINIKIGTWYMNNRIPKMLHYYKINDIIEHRLIAYNFGIGNLIKYLKGEVQLPLETINYINKYNKRK